MNPIDVTAKLHAVEEKLETLFQRLEELTAKKKEKDGLTLAETAELETIPLRIKVESDSRIALNNRLPQFLPQSPPATPKKSLTGW